MVLQNLQSSGFKGPVFPVDTGRLNGRKKISVRQLAELAPRPDLAVIAARAGAVPDLIDQCGKVGIGAAIILSSGFSDIGERGAALERKVARQARRYGLRFLGPNSPGLIRSSIGLNVTVGQVLPVPGRIALVSQSGALCTAILDWAASRQIGFSSVIATGSPVDIGLGEILDFLLRDPETDSILLYLEAVQDSRRFMSALRAAARVKPVVVMKAGRHARDSQAAMSHTGVLVGSEEVFDAALRRAGVLRVHDFSDFVAAAATLDVGVRLRGNRLAILTNAEGPGTMAADHVADRGLELPEFSKESLRQLRGLAARRARVGNPIDVGAGGRADRYATLAERYAKAASTCLADPTVDGLLAILTPPVRVDPDEVARQLCSLTAAQKKPVFTCWLGGDSMAASRKRFLAAGIPTYGTPEGAVDAFSALARYAANQQLLLQVPAPLGRESAPDGDGARLIIEAALEAGQEWLNPAESKAVLAAFRIPIVRSLPAHSAAEAVTIAQEIGFPVVMKILSPGITHKSEVGGVRLGLASAPSVRENYQSMLAEVSRRRPEARLDGVLIEPMHAMRYGRELMVGVVRDEIFGPVISFGLGGAMVEVIKDRAVALPPLNRFLARDLVRRTRAGDALRPLGGAPAADAAAVEDLLLRVSEIACELPQIEEMDLNPVVASESGAVVVDARIRVKKGSPAARPYAHMAIHPYPSGLVRKVELADGVLVTVRPIRPEDAVIETEFVNGLSEQSKFLRFMYALHEITPAMLSRFTQIDYDREMALVVVVDTPEGEKQIGVARYATMPDEETCEFAIVLADEWQGKGLARLLMSMLVDAARDRQLRAMTGMTLQENGRMIELSRSLGFETRTDPEDRDLVLMTLKL
jgi:acetyltransferase